MSKHDTNKIIGFCDALVLHDSLSKEALEFICEELNLPSRSVIHAIPLHMFEEFRKNETEYPINPKLFAVGEQASEIIGERNHEKIEYNV